MTAALTRALNAARDGYERQVVMRIANLTIRAVLLISVGALTFIRAWPGVADASIQVAALAVASIALLVWVPADRLAPTHIRYASLFPYGLAVVIVLCGVASATHTGGLFNVLTAITTVIVGADTSLLAGVAIAAVGVLATEIAAVAISAGATVTVAYALTLILGLVFGRLLHAYQVTAAQATALLAQAEELRAEQTRTAALDERARIAREIHDVLAHSLGALGLQVQAARAVLTARHDEAHAVELLQQAQTMAADGLNETRRAVHALRGSTAPLPETLEQLAAAHQRRHRALVTVKVEGDRRTGGPDAQLAILRAAQEALVNAAKHAPQQPITIHLTYTDSNIALRVSNPIAHSYPSETPSEFGTVNGGYGLQGIRERIVLLGGTLTAGPTTDAWVLDAELQA